MTHDILPRLGELGLIPVVAIEDATAAPPLARALIDGGLPCAEITFRTAAAADAIRAMVEAAPDMLIGAGTVLNVEQARQAVEAGARFIVSPGFGAAVVDFCQSEGLPVMPGVATPSEIMQALAKDLHVLKFFPAEAMGGIGTLKAIGGPFGGVKFIPTGGINADNIGDYLRLPLVHACGGSWIVKKALISGGQYDEITRLTREALDVIRQIRS